MAQDELVARMTDYLERQIAQYKRQISEHEDAAREGLDQGLENLVTMSNAHAVESAMLEREFNALLREWKAAHEVSEEQRSGVRLLAREAEALANRLGAMLAFSLSNAEERRDAVRNELASLAKGQSILNRYRAGGAPQPGRVDERA
jgi:hypothetical protein